MSKKFARSWAFLFFFTGLTQILKLYFVDMSSPLNIESGLLVGCTDDIVRIEDTSSHKEHYVQRVDTDIMRLIMPYVSDRNDSVSIQISYYSLKSPNRSGTSARYYTKIKEVSIRGEKVYESGDPFFGDKIFYTLILLVGIYLYGYSFFKKEPKEVAEEKQKK